MKITTDHHRITTDHHRITTDHHRWKILLLIIVIISIPIFIFNPAISQGIIESTPYTEADQAKLSVADQENSTEFTFEKHLANGEVYSNGTHHKAIITGGDKYVYEAATESYQYYEYIQRNDRHFVRSVYGVWELSKADGVVLMDNTNGSWEKVFDYENWTLVFNGSPQDFTDQEIRVNYRNAENASISLIETFADGWLNETYSWNRGELKLSVGLRAASTGNYRIALQLGGLDLHGFTRTNITQLNTSKYALNFDDMYDKIDQGQSSYVDGVLTLVSNNYALNPSDERVFDPTSYFQGELNEWFSMSSAVPPSGTYLGTQAPVYWITGQWILFGSLSTRCWLNFNMSSLLITNETYPLTILNANLNLTLRTPFYNPIGQNFLAIGRNVSYEADKFNTTLMGSTSDPQWHDTTHWNDPLMFTGMIPSSQHPDLVQFNEYTWNVSDFTKYWFANKNASVEKISWQITKYLDMVIGNVGALQWFTPDTLWEPELEIIYTIGLAPPIFVSWSVSSVDNYPYTNVFMSVLVVDLDNQTTQLNLTIFYSNDSFVTDNRSYSMVYNNTPQSNQYNFTYTWAGQLGGSYDFYYTANDGTTTTGKYNPTVGSYFVMSWRGNYAPFIVAWFDSTLLIDPFANVLFDCTIYYQENVSADLNVTIWYSIDGFALDNRTRIMNFATETAPYNFRYTYNWIGEAAGIFYQYYYQVEAFNESYFITHKPQNYDIGILFDIQWDLIIVGDDFGAWAAPIIRELIQEDNRWMYWLLLLLGALSSYAYIRKSKNKYYY